MMLSNEALIPIAVFLAISLGAWALLGMAATKPKTAEDRLRRLLEGRGAAAADANVAKRQEVIQARVAAAAGKLGQSLRPSDAQELGKIRLKLLNAGFRQEQAVAVFFGIKLIGLLIGLAVSFPGCFFKWGLSQPTYITTACATALGFYIPDSFVGHRKKKRGESVFLGLPDALDLMVVCVEAGLGLDAAMRRVTSELANSCPVICEEFAIANFQIQMGRARRDVLRDLGVQRCTAPSCTSRSRRRNRWRLRPAFSSSSRDQERSARARPPGRGAPSRALRVRPPALPPSPPADPEGGYAWFLGTQLEEAGVAVFVAERAGDVIGYVYTGLEPQSWKELRDEAGFVHDVIVADEGRRLGIASGR